MNTEAQLIWEDVLKVVSSRIEDGKALPWFERLIPQSIENNVLTCTTKLNFTIRLFMHQYKELTEKILQEITMEPYQFVLLEDAQAPDQYISPYTQKVDVTQVNHENPVKLSLKPADAKKLSTQDKQNPKPHLKNPVQESVTVEKSSTQNTMRPKLKFKKDADLSWLWTPEGVTPEEYYGVVSDSNTPELDSETQEPVQACEKTYDPYARTFDTFIVGDSNSAASASAQRVAEMPGKVFNPFFLYSKSGLGKTHLLMAIKNYIERYYPDKNTLYVTSEQFLQDYIKELAESRKKQTGQPIMTKYRSVDVLLIDDIQFLEGKNESQEYFFATFEELTRRGAQIVLSADRSPKDLHMDERMTSRFQAGLCQNIQPPSFELKLAILKTFYERNAEVQSWYDAQLSDGILHYIAEVSSSNIREIEGFLTQVMVYASNKNKAGQAITKEDVSSLASETFNIRKKLIKISTIQHEVAKFYQLTRDDLVGPQRHKNINQARQTAMYLARTLTDESFASIGKHFGGRDHTTILNGVQKIEKLVKQDRSFFDDLEKLTEIIKQMS